MLATDYFVILFLLAQLMFLLAAYIFAISGIDDLILDLIFYLGPPSKRGPQANRTQAEYMELCGHPPPAHFAIMLPAWDEADILYSAVRRMLRNLDYPNYVIFIGVYPNDPRSIEEAQKLQSESDRVRVVVTPEPGPTCKADCLNAIIRGIGEFEKQTGIRIEGYLMQDAEDVINPEILKILNAGLTRYPAVQIPVLSLIRRPSRMVAGHYMDEFAESHSKDMLVRQYLSGSIPGAGVGTCYSRKAIEVARTLYGEPFNTSTLTEDYDLAMRLHRHGIDHAVLWIRSEVEGVRTPYAITQEYFPAGFWQSVRQKTRWTIGICFQGWQLIGWRGTFMQKFYFWRDRKMIFFSHGIFLGYVAITLYAGLWAYHQVDPSGYNFPPLLPLDHPMWWVIWFNVFLFFHRIIQRHVWTYYHYGGRATILALPRYFVAITINYFAMCRATKIWFVYLWNRKPIGWDKTQHEFLEDEENIDGEVTR
ncbi:hypothetical protein E1162_01425 [Rhodobacteraceae bacterium RKSG542]|uniref:glycosyltransferase n=1 Tax=Pseudovibrio flavus TaxID=2529854 RepID=UPI0012BB5387|nr:glycosyltransferase [Pseudovibrio flavus]MTI15894.1 hypothetical protein [Pseudovibrio flavus]